MYVHVLRVDSVRVRVLRVDSVRVLRTHCSLLSQAKKFHWEQIAMQTELVALWEKL